MVDVPSAVQHPVDHHGSIQDVEGNTGAAFEADDAQAFQEVVPTRPALRKQGKTFAEGFNALNIDQGWLNSVAVGEIRKEVDQVFPRALREYDIISRLGYLRPETLRVREARRIPF